MAIKTITISSSECEGSFSAMNNIVTWKRNVLTPKHISSLLFIKCVGPPVDMLNPTSYVQLWIISGKRSAEEICCPKRIKKDNDNHIYTSLWNYLNNDPVI
jgi:hypothetical protein